MKLNLSIALCGVAVIFVIWLQASCAELPPARIHRPESPDLVKTMKLPELDPVLPAGKGRETVALMCSVCHTPHYILNQPPFSREVWTAEVTKMQKTYSAPIPDEKVPEILDYLIAVRGPAAN